MSAIGAPPVAHRVRLIQAIANLKLGIDPARHE
jgi:hypothetical protein